MKRRASAKPRPSMMRLEGKPPMKHKPCGDRLQYGQSPPLENRLPLPTTLPVPP